MDNFTWITENINELVVILSMAVATASALSTFLNSDNDDPIIARIIAVVDIIAFNWGKARNADKVKTDIVGTPVVSETSNTPDAG